MGTSLLSDRLICRARLGRLRVMFRILGMKSVILRTQPVVQQMNGTPSVLMPLAFAFIEQTAAADQAHYFHLVFEASSL